MDSRKQDVLPELSMQKICIYFPRKRLRNTTFSRVTPITIHVSCNHALWIENIYRLSLPATRRIIMVGEKKVTRSFLTYSTIHLMNPSLRLLAPAAAVSLGVFCLGSLERCHVIIMISSLRLSFVTWMSGGWGHWSAGRAGRPARRAPATRSPGGRPWWCRSLKGQ